MDTGTKACSFYINIVNPEYPNNTFKEKIYVNLCILGGVYRAPKHTGADQIAIVEPLAQDVFFSIKTTTMYIHTSLHY